MSIRATIEVIRPMLNQARALCQLAETLETLSVSENHKEELQDEIGQLKEYVQRLKDEAIVVSQDAEARARKVKEEGDALLASATIAAQTLADEARKICSEKKFELDQYVQVKTIEATALQDHIDVLKATVASLAVERDGLAAEIKALRDKVSSL